MIWEYSQDTPVNDMRIQSIKWRYTQWYEIIVNKIKIHSVNDMRIQSIKWRYGQWYKYTVLIWVYNEGYQDTAKDIHIPSKM